MPTARARRDGVHREAFLIDIEIRKVRRDLRADRPHGLHVRLAGLAVGMCLGSSKNWTSRIDAEISPQSALFTDA
jgi:hypothetical protein